MSVAESNNSFIRLAVRATQGAVQVVAIQSYDRCGKPKDEEVKIYVRLIAVNIDPPRPHIC